MQMGGDPRVQIPGSENSSRWRQDDSRESESWFQERLSPLGHRLFLAPDSPRDLRAGRQLTLGAPQCAADRRSSALRSRPGADLPHCGRRLTVHGSPAPRHWELSAAGYDACHAGDSTQIRPPRRSRARRTRSFRRWPDVTVLSVHQAGNAASHCVLRRAVGPYRHHVVPPEGTSPFVPPNHQRTASRRIQR